MVRDSNHNNNKEGSQDEESPIFSFFSIPTAWNNTNIFPIFSMPSDLNSDIENNNNNEGNREFPTFSTFSMPSAFTNNLSQKDGESNNNPMKAENNNNVPFMFGFPGFPNNDNNNN